MAQACDGRAGGRARQVRWLTVRHHHLFWNWVFLNCIIRLVLNGPPQASGVPPPVQTHLTQTPTATTTDTSSWPSLPPCFASHIPPFPAEAQLGFQPFPFWTSRQWTGLSIQCDTWAPRLPSCPHTPFLLQGAASLPQPLCKQKERPTGSWADELEKDAGETNKTGVRVRD